MKLKNLSHRLQFKMKKSSKQQHELEKICRIHCIYRKPDKMNEKPRNLSTTGRIFFYFFFIKTDAQLVINNKTRTVFNFENFS